MIDAPLDEPIRPGHNQVFQEVLSQRPRFELMNGTYNPLFLPVLTLKARRVVKGSESEASYGDVVRVRLNGDMLNAPP